MWIVKETNEDKINKAVELAGRQSKKLVDTINDSLKRRGTKNLTVEIIDEAISLFNKVEEEAKS